MRETLTTNTAQSRAMGTACTPRTVPQQGSFLAILDSWANDAYESGFTQSFLVHVLVLLILAIVVIPPESHSPPIALALKFESFNEDDNLLDLSPVAELSVSTESSEEPLNEAATAEVFTASDLPADVAISVQPEDMLPVDTEQQLDRLNMSTADLLTEVRLPRSVPTFRAVLRGPSRGGQTVSRGDGTPGVGGIDGELGRRLQAAGAKTGDVQISIRWDNVNDIDVHVRVEALNDGRWSLINFMNRLGQCGGMLDVDANAHPAMLVPQPVENIFWGKGRAPYGRYTVAIHHYRNWAGPVQTPVEVAVLVDGQVQRFQVNAIYGAPPTFVTSFVRQLPLLPKETDRGVAATDW